MIGGIAWSETFPTKTTLFIFLGYMSLFVCQGIFVTASQDKKSNKYKYNTVVVVLITELVKLIVSVLLYWKSNSLTAFAKETIANKKMLLLYFIPSFLYCVYNNLTFKNLSTFDPTTYYLLLQFRVVITGILFQLIFSKILSKRQWFSLILLTTGCMAKQLNFDTILDYIGIGDGASNSTATATADVSTGAVKNTTGFDLSIDAIFIFVQLLCSCLAGVYNEYLLKGDGAKVNIFVQNLFMYVDSMICNIIFLAYQGNILETLTVENLQPVFTFNVIIIIINNAAIGITTSFFLRYLNSILKTFASALELCFTAILCYILFQIPVHLNTMLSIGIVSIAIYLYTLSPVVNPANKSTTDECKPTPEIAVVHVDTEDKETKETYKSASEDV